MREIDLQNEKESFKQDTRKSVMLR